MLVLDNTAISEARLLHPGSDGFIAICQKTKSPSGDVGWKQKSIHISGMEQALSAVARLPDTYISQASFVSRNRVISATKDVSCCWVDLDCYNLGILPDESTIQAILTQADRFGIPRPSWIVRSGCGLYAKWLFDQPLSANWLQSWNEVQNTLVLLFKFLGADPKSRDSARILRATSTVNSKNGSIVEVVHNEGRRHKFLDLVKALNSPELLATLDFSNVQIQRKIKVNQSKIALIEDLGNQDLSRLVNYSQMREPIMMANKSLQSLNWSRFLDLRDLMISRGGAKRGSRDLFAFWLTSTLASAGIVNPENFWNEVQQILPGFQITKDFNPAQDGSLTSLYKRIQAAHLGHKFKHKGCEYSPVYTPANDTLINMFEITAQEESQLRTIISSAEKRRRADLKVPGRAQRREERNDIRQDAKKLREQGLNANQIAQKLDVNRSTVCRWFKVSEKPLIEAAKTPAAVDHTNWNEDQKQAWRDARIPIIEEQKRKIALLEEQEKLLAATREAQAGLEASLKMEALISKIKESAGLICNQDMSRVSLVRNNPQPKPDLPGDPTDSSAKMSSVKNILNRIQPRTVETASAAIPSPTPVTKPVPNTVVKSRFSRFAANQDDDSIERPFDGFDETAPPLPAAPVPTIAVEIDPGVEREVMALAGDTAATCSALEARDIPEGSHFNALQWGKMDQTCGEDQVVVEMYDEAKGRRLYFSPRIRTGPDGESDDLESKLLAHSLLIAEDVYQSLEKKGEAPVAHARYIYRQSAYKPCTPVTYMVVRSQASIDRMPWLNGLVWRNFEADAHLSEVQRSSSPPRRSETSSNYGYSSQRPSSFQPRTSPKVVPNTNQSRFAGIGSASSNSLRRADSPRA